MSDTIAATTAASAPMPDPRVRKPLTAVAALLIGGAALALIAFPIVVAVMLGEAPYDLLHVGYPGVDVAVITTSLLSGAQLATLVTSGALVHLLFLRDAPARTARYLSEGFEITVLRIASGAWAVCAGALVVFEALDSNGTPLARLATPSALPFLWEASYAPKAWTISFLAALIVFFVSFFSERWTGLMIPLWATGIAVLAPVVSGQVLVGPDHDFGSDAAIFQTIAVNAFFGAALVAVMRVVSGRLVSPLTLRRLFRIGVVALPVIVVSDVIIAVFKLAGGDIAASLTGWLILAGFACLVVITVVFVVAAILARRGKLRAGHITGLLSLAAVAVAGWTGVGVAMTRQPPPQYFVPTSIEQVFMGFEVPDAPTLGVLFGQWRPNLLFLGIAAAAIIVYLVAVRTLHRRGDRWPLGRTAAWIGGWTVVV
ncbi:MAG: cytochrome c oxidase assembly protein, partial [Mycetocola reblochoni]